MALTSDGLVASPDGGGGSTSTNVDPPDGIQAGDLWLLAIVADMEPAGVINTPSGFTPCHDQVAGLNGFPAIRTFYKIAGASEAAVAISMDDDAYVMRADSILKPGPYSGNPIGNVNPAFSADSDTTFPAPSVEVQNNGTDVLLVFACNNVTSITQPGTSTLLQSVAGADVWPGMATAYETVDQGTYNPGTWTLGSGSHQVGVTIEILPPGGSTGIPVAVAEGAEIGDDVAGTVTPAPPQVVEGAVTEGAEIGESVSASVTPAPPEVVEGAVAEGAALSDAVSASVTPAPADVYQGTVTEGIVIGHRLGPAKTIDFPAEGAELGDTVSAEVVEAVETVTGEVTEGAEIGDTVSAEVVPLPPGTVTGQVSEGAEMGDVASATLVPREPITVEGAVAEGAEIGDTASATLVPADAEVFPVLVSEGIAIGDSWAAVVDSPEVFEVAVDEGAIIGDVWTARVPRSVGPLTAAAVRHRPALTIAEVTRMPIYLDSDNTIEVIGLRDANDETVTNATVTASLIRRGQTEPVWSGVLSHIGGGDYRVDVPDDLEANEGEILIERIVISAGDTDATLQVDRRVRRRLS